MELNVEDNEMLQPPWLEPADSLKSAFCPTKPQAKIHSSSKPVKILLFTCFKALSLPQLTSVLSSQGNCFYLYARSKQLSAIWLDGTSRDILSALLYNPSAVALFEIGIFFFPPFFITEVLLNSLFAIINFTICLLLLHTRNMTSASEYIWFQSVHLTCCQGTVFWSSYLVIKKRKKEKSRSWTVTDTEVTTSIQIFLTLAYIRHICHKNVKPAYFSIFQCYILKNAFQKVKVKKMGVQQQVEVQVSFTTSNTVKRFYLIQLT